MTRLDHNRAKAQLAAKTGVPVADVTRMTIWGNHSATQYPDVFHARVGGRNAAEVIGDQAWIENEFIPTVQQRGAAVIEARGSSSAASAANAAIDHVHDWMLGTPAGDWVSMAVCSDGAYGVTEGLISGFPVTTADGAYASSPVSRSTPSRGPASTPRSPSWPRSATRSQSSACSVSPPRTLGGMVAVPEAETPTHESL